MSKGNQAIVFVLVLAVIAVFAAKQGKQKSNESCSGTCSIQASCRSTNEPSDLEPEIKATKTLPRLVDLGAGKCIPCKMMSPILEQLDREYTGTFDVEFIDVWKNPKAGEEYGIRVIPTQIFYDSNGRELFRHEGFFSREDILAKWQEYGIAVADQKD